MTTPAVTSTDAATNMGGRNPARSTIGLWGPPQVGGTQGVSDRAPEERRAWGLIDVLWGLLGLLVAQIVLLPILTVVAIVTYDIPIDAPGAAASLTEAVTKVATTGPGIVFALLSQWAAFVGAPWLVSRRKGHQSMRLDFGLRFRWRDVPVGFGVAVGLQVVLNATTWLLHQTPLDLSGAENTSQVTDHAGVILVVMVLAAAIGAPLTEEIFFRGLMLRSMLRGFARLDFAPVLEGVSDKYHTGTTSAWRRRVGTVAAVVLSSVLFGIMHLQTSATDDGGTAVLLGHWVVVAQTGLLGMVFAVIAIKTRRIGLTIMAHLFFNSTSLALVFLTN